MSVEAAPLTAARKRKGRWAIASVVSLAVIAGVVAAILLLQPRTSSTAAVSSAVVARKTLSVLVSGTGSTVVADSVTVNPTVSGTVQKLYVTLGESVTAGQDLYTISSTDADAKLLQAKGSLLQSKQSVQQAKGQLQQAESQVYSANTQLIQAKQNLRKLQSEPATTPGRANDITIAARQVTSAKAGVTSAETGVASAEIGVRAAAANLASAQSSYDDALALTKDTVVTAPIDGVVTALPISVGSAVSAGTTTSSNSGTSASSSGGSSASGGSASGATSSSGSSASGSVTISDMGSLKVQVSVSEVDIPSVARGQKATVTFDAIADRTFSGKVTAISPNGTTSSGVVNYDVDITLDSLDPSLKPNMTATADIATKVASNVLVVPIAAIKTRGGAKYVEVVGPNGVVTRRAVTVGVSDDTYTEVKTGVTQGAYVSTGSTASSAAGSSGSASSSSSRSSGGGFMMGGPSGGAPPSGGPGGN